MGKLGEALAYWLVLALVLAAIGGGIWAWNEHPEWRSFPVRVQ